MPKQDQINLCLLGLFHYFGESIYACEFTLPDLVRQELGDDIDDTEVYLAYRALYRQNFIYLDNGMYLLVPFSGDKDNGETR